MISFQNAAGGWIRNETRLPQHRKLQTTRRRQTSERRLCRGGTLDGTACDLGRHIGGSAAIPRSVPKQLHRHIAVDSVLPVHFTVH